MPAEDLQDMPEGGGLMPAPLAELNAALADFEPIAAQVSSLKAETARREAEILEQIISRVTPLVSIIGRKGESFYRRDIILVSRKDAAPVALDSPSQFFSEHVLVFYETGALYDLHRFGETCCREIPRPGWELCEERELSAREAVASFGLAEIASGMIKALQDAKGVFILKAELEARVDTLTQILEALA